MLSRHVGGGDLRERYYTREMMPEVGSHKNAAVEPPATFLQCESLELAQGCPCPLQDACPQPAEADVRGTKSCSRQGVPIRCLVVRRCCGRHAPAGRTVRASQPHTTSPLERRI